MLRPALVYSLFGVLLLNIASQAQYKGDDIPGFLGLQSGTQAPPGLYIGNVVWVYPTDTVKDDNGNKINSGNGSLTSTLNVILLSWVSNYKVLGANYGATVAIPFIKNRIQLNSLDVNSGFAFTDMIVTPISLGWHRKRANFNAGYNLYLPTGRFSAGGTDNTGLGMYGNEFFVGTTVYLDPKKLWSAAGTFCARVSHRQARHRHQRRRHGDYSGRRRQNLLQKGQRADSADFQSWSGLLRPIQSDR